MNISVIGGGAAGMIAALSAAENGADVVLFERNDNLGRKLRITGKGRCNVTNNCDVAAVLQNVVTNPKFLNSAVRKFPPSEVMSFFEALGVPLKTERGQRVFPGSDNANDVADALIRRLSELGVTVKHERVTALPPGIVIIACGGVSYPKTGSNGDGYHLAKSAGHSVTETFASLVPLESSDTFCKEMQGFSLKNVRVSLETASGKKLFEDFGEMQFTHFGVSGPLILSASAHIPRNATFPLTLAIDLKPALDEKTLDARLLRDFEKFANKDFQNALGELAGRLMIPVLVSRSGIAPNVKVNSVTKEQRGKLLAMFKRFTVNVSGTRPLDEAVITRGGVSVAEVNPATMESKFRPGLFFAGEVLDVDAYTGGFNLQIAWSTGRLAGLSAAKAATAP